MPLRKSRVTVKSAQFFASLILFFLIHFLSLSLFLSAYLSILFFIANIPSAWNSDAFILEQRIRFRDIFQAYHDVDRNTIFCRWQTSPASRYASEEVHEEAGHTVQLGHGQVPLPQLQQWLRQTGHHARPLQIRVRQGT